MAKEKRNKNIMVMVTKSMYKEFIDACQKDHITMSEHLRACMRKKIKEENNT